MSLDNNSLVNVRFSQVAIFYFTVTCFPEEQRKFQHTNILFIFQAKYPSTDKLNFVETEFFLAGFT